MKEYCEVCRGSGYVSTTHGDVSNHYVHRSECKDCDGKGYVDVYSASEELLNLMEWIDKEWDLEYGEQLINPEDFYNLVVNFSNTVKS